MDGSARLTLRAVGAVDGYHEVEPLLHRHYDEIAKFKDLAVVNPDLDRYAKIDAEGRFIGLIAENEGQIVGYSANFIAQNLHYSDLRYCQNDVLYVVPEHRDSRMGLSLIRQTVKCAKEKGAQLMLWHAKDKTTLDILLPRLGYEIMDIIWAKRI